MRWHKKRNEKEILWKNKVKLLNINKLHFFFVIIKINEFK